MKTKTMKIEDRENSARGTTGRALTAIAVIAAGLISTGCLETIGSDEVSPQAIYQSYTVEYTEGSGQLKGHATFYVGGSLGTTVALTAPNRVLFQGKEMSMQSFFGTSYYRTISTTPPSQAGFEFIDEGGNSYVNTFALMPFQTTAAPEAVSRTGEVQFTVQGQALSAPGDWGIELAYSTSSSSGICFITARRSGSAIRGSMADCHADLAGVSAVSISLEFARWHDLQAATPRGGNARVSFRSRDYRAKLIP